MSRYIQRTSQYRKPRKLGGYWAKEDVDRTSNVLLSKNAILALEKLVVQGVAVSS